MRISVIFRLGLPLLCWLFILAGCAGKQPKTLPLNLSEEQEARALWSSFLAGKHPQALDADIRLGWDVLGSKGGVAATVLVQQPSFLRFTANDPLGRSFILAVADATSFTMVDNRSGHVFRGGTGSKFWRSYVPESISPEQLLSFLGGFLSDGDVQAKPAQDENNRAFWYQWRDKRALRHAVLLDRGSGVMQRRLLFDAQGELILEMRYSNYKKDSTNGFVWPGHVQITGKAVTGALTVQVEKIYSHTSQGAAAFHLSPPPHFTVEEVL
jgi:hypothetical protein